ncbi:MAG: polysaccharide deacetylase family protein [Pedobacter sp.]|nr:MAG: polysaccharide deacetylase family protein [Pedobacter sp.]
MILFDMLFNFKLILGILMVGFTSIVAAKPAPNKLVPIGNPIYVASEVPSEVTFLFNPDSKLILKHAKDTSFTTFLGAINRGPKKNKKIALVLTGDEFADGGDKIYQTLKEKNVKASFFLTGRFYKNPTFKSIITKLHKAGHYMGAHSDQHLLYNDWTKRDSLLVDYPTFKKDLLDNYVAMQAFGIKSSDAPYYLPPYEWYNQTIADWTKGLNFTLVNFTAGTRSTADYTYPEMGKSYRGSAEIYQSIFDYESKDPYGLNGFILLIHIGTDPRRPDKFYDHLPQLIDDLQAKGYSLVKLNELLNTNN